MAVNAVLAAAKFVAGILGHSHALVADAVESMSDIFSSVVVWRGLVVAAEPADEDHPYGHGKAEPIAAAVVSTMLLAAAAWIGVTAIREIRQPHQSPEPYTLVVLIAVVIIKESLFRFVRRQSIEVSSTAVATDAWHHRSDAITSLAAAVGITIALIGGHGYEVADDYAAALASLVIAFNGWFLLRQAVNELMDRSPGAELVSRIRELAAGIDGVDCVEKCYARKMGYHYFVDMHLQVNPGMSVKESHRLAHVVKAHICEALPQVSDVLVHVEPSAADETPSDQAGR